MIAIPTTLFNFPETARLTDAVSGESFALAELHHQLNAWQQLLKSLKARRIVFRAQSSVQWALLDSSVCRRRFNYRAGAGIFK